MTHNFLKLAVGLLAGLSLLSACTKERPYEEVPKTEYGIKLESKSVISTEDEYIFVPSIMETGRRSSAAIPHFMGKGQLVRFNFAESHLRVVRPDDDGRWTDNPTNADEVLAIPIEHIDYTCVRDAYNECTRKEERNERISWDKRRYFQLKPEELKLIQPNFIPVEIDAIFTGGRCYQEVSSEFVRSEFKEDAFNIVLEKTYQTKLPCVDWTSLENLEDLSFSMRIQYSFVKVKSLADPDYQPLEYTRKDERVFGFFNTERNKLNVDNNDNVDGQKFYLDRWNPKRKKIVYHLSENFLKPENRAIKEASYRAVDAINKAFRSAFREDPSQALQIELRDPAPGLSPADLKVNMIVAVEDPTAVNLAGYGPHVSHPFTGEILHARTVMYPGVMRKFVQWHYDEIVRAKRAGSRTPANLTMSPSVAASEVSQVKAISELAGAATELKLNSLAKIRPGDIVAPGLDLKRMTELGTDPTANQIFAYDLKKLLQGMSEHCLYTMDMMDFSGMIGEGVDEVIEIVGLKPWDQLTKDEQQMVVDKLLPYAWIPTLIHELGHNLGLRHNFAGSEDKDNFYTAEELKELGATTPYMYSSVMDYGYRVYNELRTMGKYDIAALRFGYAEKIDLQDGTSISLSQFQKNREVPIKEYGYCTDEHVDANPNCNRFDEGTNMLEMAQHYVRAYEEGYLRRNFRNNRRSFSMFRDIVSLSVVDDTFWNMRLMYERYEMIKNRFDLPDNAKEWNDIQWLKETKQAAITAGQFMLNVVKTPDLLCAVAQSSKPTEIIALLPIRFFTKDAISCFDSESVRLNPDYVVVAEAGKSYTSRKSPYNENFYADQIDVRGIYINKLLALDYLFRRELGSTIFDDYTDNFLSVPELQGPIMETIGQIVNDYVVGPVEFRTREGETTEFNIAYNLFDARPNHNAHLLMEPVDWRARFLLRLPQETTVFQLLFLDRVISLNQSDIDLGMTEAINAMFRVRDYRPLDGRPDSDYLVTQIGAERYFTLKNSQFGALLFQSLRTVNILGQLTEAQLQAILAAPNADALEGIEKEAKLLGNAVIQRYLRGGFQAPAYYATMIKHLAWVSNLPPREYKRMRNVGFFYSMEDELLEMSKSGGLGLSDRPGSLPRLSP